MTKPIQFVVDTTAKAVTPTRGRPKGSKNKTSTTPKPITAVNTPIVNQKIHMDAGIYSRQIPKQILPIKFGNFKITSTGSIMIMNISTEFLSEMTGIQETLSTWAKSSYLMKNRTIEELREIYPNESEERLSKRKRSVLKIWEIGEYKITNGVSNVEELLGKLKHTYSIVEQEEE